MLPPIETITCPFCDMELAGREVLMKICGKLETVIIYDDPDPTKKHITPFTGHLPECYTEERHNWLNSRTGGTDRFEVGP